MNRRDFIVNSCAACLGASALSVMLNSCTSARYINGVMGKDGLTVPVDAFAIKKKDSVDYRSYIIVGHENLQHPVCVYRLGETEYTALWMRCTHQGAELQVSGDHLQCAAHGSEFNNRGAVTNGPAAGNLRSFPVTLSNNELFIDMRKP